MRILLAQSAGFCFGVKRATNMAFKAAEQHCPICSLGPIIHSPQLVEKLAEKGVEVVKNVDDLHGGAVIIRSHGVTSGEMEALQKRQIEVVDATCPFVKKAQQHAAMLSREGYSVVLVGEEEHPEVQGIVSYAAKGDVFVVADRSQAENLPMLPRMGIVAQTTQSFDNFQQIVDVCLGKSHELRVFNTICDATSVRQNEAKSLASQSDLMIVVGGFNSANTNRLAQICQEIQPHTRHVETVDQIDPEWFAGVQVVGITAGASTPRWLIEEVVSVVSAIGK